MNLKFIGDVPEILITNTAWNKMTQYTKLVDTEIGWLGTVEIDENIFTITDVFLVKQEVNGTTCEIDPNAIIEMYEEKINNNLPTDNIILWGHSHCNMGVSPSGRDEDQLEEFAENNEYFIRLIMNKRGDVNLALVDVQREIIYEDLDFKFAYEDSDDDILQEIEEKVSKKVYIPTTTTTFNSSCYNQLNNYKTSLYGDYDVDHDNDYLYDDFDEDEIAKIREKDIDDLTIEEAKKIGLI